MTACSCGSGNTDPDSHFWWCPGSFTKEENGDEASGCAPGQQGPLDSEACPHGVNPPSTCAAYDCLSSAPEATVNNLPEGRCVCGAPQVSPFCKAKVHPASAPEGGAR